MRAGEGLSSSLDQLRAVQSPPRGSEGRCVRGGAREVICVCVCDGVCVCQRRGSCWEEAAVVEGVSGIMCAARGSSSPQSRCPWSRTGGRKSLDQNKVM